MNLCINFTLSSKTSKKYLFSVLYQQTGIYKQEREIMISKINSNINFKGKVYIGGKRDVVKGYLRDAMKLFSPQDRKLVLDNLNEIKEYIEKRTPDTDVFEIGVGRSMDDINARELISFYTYRNNECYILYPAYGQYNTGGKPQDSIDRRMRTRGIKEAFKNGKKLVKQNFK